MDLKDELNRLLGCVNRQPFQGKAAGTLLVSRTDTETPDFIAPPRVAVRLLYEPNGWNNVQTRDGPWRPVVDSKGMTLYTVADFPPEDNGWEWVVEDREPVADEPVTAEARDG